MLRNLYSWQSTIKINGRMYIIWSDVKCEERSIKMQLSWIDTKRNFMESIPAFRPSCLTLQVNFHETEINWHVKEPPSMTLNNNNQWENVHIRVWCEVCGKEHYNAIELNWHKAKFRQFKFCLSAKMPYFTGEFWWDRNKLIC